MVATTADTPSLVRWLGLDPDRRKLTRRRLEMSPGHVRFAFYGRMSTREYQDLPTSRAWQVESANGITTGHGTIVAEYFDVHCSRRMPWDRRPQAAALLEAAASPNRTFDAVVIGEYERAFHGNQLPETIATLTAAGVQLWMPETGGPVDLRNPTQQALMMLLGHQSSREALGPVPHHGGDAHSSPRPEPPPGRPPTLRLPTRRCRPPSEHRPCPRPAPAPPGS